MFVFYYYQYFKNLFVVEKAVEKLVFNKNRKGNCNISNITNSYISIYYQNRSSNLKLTRKRFMVKNSTKTIYVTKTIFFSKKYLVNNTLTAFRNFNCDNIEEFLHVVLRIVINNSLLNKKNSCLQNYKIEWKEFMQCHETIFLSDDYSTSNCWNKKK